MDETSTLAEAILDQMADAVIYADDTGTIRRWNHAAAALFGYSAAEALGQNLDLIIPEHLRPAHWRGFEAAITSGVMKLQGRPTLTRATHQTGRKLYVEMTFALVKGQAGSGARGAVAVARDVTERIEQQRAGARRESPEDR
jgi:PAS domain S-box-containing protein